jgi:phage N-6-adenine-methyltransferase
MSAHNQDIETPVAFVRAVENFLGIEFKYDMAATSQNKKAPEYISEEGNSLTMLWPTNGWCWLNPPFRNLSKWINKCDEQMRRGCNIVSIWPLSGDRNQITTWQKAGVYIIHGRIWPEVRGCMLCVWNKNIPLYIHGLRWDGKTLEKIW